MPNLDRKGPGSLGSKTGKKLGKCKKTEAENKEIEEIYSFKKETSTNCSSTKKLQKTIKK